MVCHMLIGLRCPRLYDLHDGICYRGSTIIPLDYEGAESDCQATNSDSHLARITTENAETLANDHYGSVFDFIQYKDKLDNFVCVFR